jgi:defect-in-organelle-trafficking protein DotC
MQKYTVSRKMTHAMLVICMAFSLVSCCIKNPCLDDDDKKKKITSKPDPLTLPYKTVSCKNFGPCEDPIYPGETMAEIKERIRTANGNPGAQGAIGALRAQNLRETALSLGARGGLAERAQQINNTLLNYEPILTKVFQFYGLMLDENVLPPVLVEARNTLNLTGTDAIRVADVNYKIIAQARFVTAPPTWRDYIWMSYDAPELPDRSLLPRTKPERIMWERDIDEGWQAGLKQADVIFMENVNRMKRDYNGMIMYRRLLAQKMVSPPFVAKMNMGVTGNSEDMTVNDRILRITALPQLQAASENWRTEIYRHE